MNTEEVLTLFRKTGALLEGHFLYASGRHGREFLQAARVLQYPEHTQTLCQAMVKPFQDKQIDVVCGPATGGIILAYESARALGSRAVFTEKEGQEMAVKRGLRVSRRDRVLVVEDVTTTGGSIQKTIDHLAQRGAEVIGVALLIDRSGGTVSFSCAYEPLARITMESWLPADCPLCQQGLSLVDPDDIVLNQ